MTYKREWNLGCQSRRVVDYTVAYKKGSRADRPKALPRGVKRRRRRLQPEAAIATYNCLEQGQELRLLENSSRNAFRLVRTNPKPQFTFGQGSDQIDRAREEDRFAFGNRRIVGEIEIFLHHNLLMRQNRAPRRECCFD